MVGNLLNPKMRLTRALGGENKNLYRQQPYQRFQATTPLAKYGTETGKDWHTEACACLCLAAQSYLTLCNPMDYSPPTLCPWNFSGKNTGVGCYFPPPGDLPNPGIKPASPVSPYYKQILYPLSHHSLFLSKQRNPDEVKATPPLLSY